MRVFANDDTGYRSWVAENRAGYVLNSYSHPNRNYLKLHRATCGTITSASRTHYTSRDYIKVCAMDIESLAAWAREETDAGPCPCDQCKPEYPPPMYTAEENPLRPDSEPGNTTTVSDEDVRGFEYWIRGYQNFYEPIVLAHFRDLGFKALKENSSIEKKDLKAAAEQLGNKTKKCGLTDKERNACIRHFEKRTRILIDGLLHKEGPRGNKAAISLECKSWGGFCKAVDTLRYFEKEGGWFMLVDKLRGNTIEGSVLAIGGEKPKGKHKTECDAIVRGLGKKYGTKIDVHYLTDMLANPGPAMKKEIQNQLDRLDHCVEKIRTDLKRWED